MNIPVASQVGQRIKGYLDKASTYIIAQSPEAYFSTIKESKQTGSRFITYMYLHVNILLQ